MADFSFPFPGRELADKELSYDLCYEKIPKQDRATIVNHAWEKGKDAAVAVYDQFEGCTDFFHICRSSGLKILEKDIDNVVGKQRYFSEYLSGKGEITLYLKSIVLWAEKNGLALRQAENLILSHEYYHFLEATKIGFASREYLVPMIRIGNLKIGKTGIRALSEIGAHAFARTYYELSRKDGNSESYLEV